MSTHQKEVNEELFSQRLHPATMSAFAMSPLLRRAVVAAGNAVKVVDLADDIRELPDDGFVVQEERGNLRQMDWTADGQVLTVASDTGVVYNYLASLPVLAEAHGTNYMYLTSLLELSVFSALAENAGKPPKYVIRIAMEPTFAALGPRHAALGMNNHVYFHELDGDRCALVAEREYLGSVDSVHLNAEMAAVCSEGRLQLHAIADAESGAARTLPDRSDDADITCAAMTKDFLLYGTSRGLLVYYYLADYAQVSEFRHETGITKIFPNELATRVVVIDDSGAGWLYHPATDKLLPIPKFSPMTSQVLWDTSDWGVIVAHDPRQVHVYVYVPHSVQGPHVLHLASTKCTSGLRPIVVNNGTLISQAESGAILNQTLQTHETIAFVAKKGGAGPEKLRLCFQENINLLRFARAWEIAKLLDDTELFAKLGQAALNSLDIPYALRAYRQMGDAAMTMALGKLERVEDFSLLAGHVALLSDDYARAQELFLSSLRPVAALEMRRDLLHWEHALKLARTLAPDQVPSIAREFAQQLEFKGDYEQALSMYKAGRVRDPTGAMGAARARALAAQDAQCRAGIARTTIRLGDVHEGIQLALETQDVQVCRDCAEILDSLKQYQDAARLYEAGEQPEKAAKIYIKTKNWSAAKPLMENISAPKLHAEYARAKEAEGKYDEAATAYERAKETDSVVRLCLERLNKPQKAFQLVRESKSSQAGLLVAKHCTSVGDHRSAIEFLLLAKRSEDAFEVAVTNEQMEAFTTALGKEGSHDEYKRVAQYYDARNDALKAGEFWFLCKDYSKALRLFLQCGERAVNQAIEVVGRARNDMLTHTLIDFLMGETDGVPKDPNFIFKLYMALGNYPQAAKTAIIISRQEQELGNYRVAHSILFDTHHELSMQRLRVSQELAHNLMLLHSYVLVKPLSKLGDHLSAARMLIRVAKNISKFPLHVVPILTSTVIECHKAGLRGSAFEYAAMLMRPEYRPMLQEPYKRKIESIVRKPGDKTDVEEPETPSPFDPSARLRETELECPSTRNFIPYCVATGRHVVLADMCLCPSCGFAACFSAFTRLIESEGACQMCLKPVDLSTIIKMEEADAKAWVVKQVAKSDKKG